MKAFNFIAMFLPAARIIRVLWALLIIYWVVAGFGNKKPKVWKPKIWRTLFSLMMFGLTLHLLASATRVRVLPANEATQCAGVLVCGAGVFFAIRARWNLGRNWSGYVMIKENHELIQRGPYALVRHPIYTGLIVALLGTVIALAPTVKGFLLVLVWGLGFYWKARREEQILTEEFGEQYQDYKRRVRGALIPALF